MTDSNKRYCSVSVAASGRRSPGMRDSSSGTSRTSGSGSTPRASRTSSSRSCATNQRSPSMTGWNGARTCSSHRPYKTNAPCLCTRVATSWPRRVLPIPGSPSSQTACACTAVIAESVANASSSSRPTNRVVAPATSSGGIGKVVVTSVGVHTTLQAATGSGSPFRSSSPTSSHSKPPRPRPRTRTRSEQRICWGDAALWSRTASTTGVPKMSSSRRTMSPAEMPIRSAIISSAGRERARASKRCWIATAAANALVAEWKVASAPSPEFLTTSPSCCSIVSFRIASCWCWS